MRAFSILSFLAMALLTGSLEAARPNVVLILVDDMGLHDLSVEGSDFYQSPNIDKLAVGE